MCKYKKMVLLGPLLTGKVGNEPLLGTEPRNVMTREETVVRL